MKRLSRSDLMSLETYSNERKAFRERVLAHKKRRIVAVGPNATWCFEDPLTVQYQIQEMLRVERIFQSAGIQDELDAYNPLIPDGTNWKATFLLEFLDPELRKQRLAGLKASKIAVGCRSKAAIGCTRSPMRIWSERTTKRHLPCTSYGSSSRHSWRIVRKAPPP